jgi:hypothetical protein
MKGFGIQSRFEGSAAAPVCCCCFVCAWLGFGLCVAVFVQSVKAGTDPDAGVDTPSHTTEHASSLCNPYALCNPNA